MASTAERKYLLNFGITLVNIEKSPNLLKNI